MAPLSSHSVLYSCSTLVQYGSFKENSVAVLQGRSTEVVVFLCLLYGKT